MLVVTVYPVAGACESLQCIPDMCKSPETIDVSDDEAVMAVGSDQYIVFGFIFY